MTLGHDVRPRPRVWVLNLDADDELRDPEGYVPFPGLSSQVERWALRLGGLLGPADLRIEQVEAGAAVPEGAVGAAWCPTPAARRRLEAAGVTPPPAPEVEVLRRVNGRGFAADLFPPLPGGRFLRSVAELEAWLGEQATRDPVGQGWVLKRGHSCAGRGLRRLPTLRPSCSLRRWAARALETDEGLVAEPWVERVQDLGLHGRVDPAGDVALGEVTRQRCSPRGEWKASERFGPGDDDRPPAEDLAALEEAGRVVGAALAAAGYFGPFGVDAFRWRDRDGVVHLRACGEVNARYSMGWAVGLGLRCDPSETGSRYPLVDARV